MSRRPRPQYRLGLEWILGVAFAYTLTRPVRLAQGLPFVRCCGSPRASSPHGLTAPAPVSHDGDDSCSCLWLAVATISPREGLSPPIQCPCQAHTPSLRHVLRAKLQRTNPGSSPLSLRGILFKRSGPALSAHAGAIIWRDRQRAVVTGCEGVGSEGHL